MEVVAKLRKEIPDIALRTTLITGFPGETEADHETLKSFVREMKFDRLGVFTYSPEEGTPAAGFAGQIDEAVKEERRDELMAIQQEIAFEGGLKAMVGQRVFVMIEGKIPEEGCLYRTYIQRCAEC